MRILVDTNICLDILQKRTNLFESSKSALLLASEKNFKLYITTATVMDIMYITRKFFESSSQQKKIIQQFISSFKLLKISKQNICKAFTGPTKDFEDAVQINCAKSNLLNLILTRNITDFIKSPVKALTPENFLEMYE